MEKLRLDRGGATRIETRGPALACLALLAFGVYLRLPGLDPAAFVNDDCWLAIAIRDMTWSEFLRIRPPVPIGFWLVQKLVSRVSNDPEWPLQIVPAAASLGIALLAGVLATRVCRDRWVGPVATAWVLASPTWIELGVRPKQYATDGLVTVALVLLAVRAWENPGPARIGTLLGACVGALTLSFPAVFVVGPTIAAALLVPSTRRALGRLEPRGSLPLAAMAMGGLLLFMRSQSSESLAAFWSERAEAYLPTHSAPEAWSLVRRFGYQLMTSPFPPSVPFLAIGAGAGLLALWRGRAGRALLTLVAGIIASLLAASALELYPSPEGGRLAAFHRPLVPVLLAVGVHGLLRWTPRPVCVSGLVVATLAALPFAERSLYRPSLNAEMARAVHERIHPGDTVITFLRAAHPLGYYVPGPREIVRQPLGAGFIARLRPPDVHYLWLGSRHRPQTEEELDRHLARALRTATDRVLFVPPRIGGALMKRRSDRILSRIVEAGYAVSTERGLRSRFVCVLHRSRPQAG